MLKSVVWMLYRMLKELHVSENLNLKSVLLVSKASKRVAMNCFKNNYDAFSIKSNVLAELSAPHMREMLHLSG